VKEGYWAEERYMQGFDGVPARKRPFGRASCRWEDSVEIGFQQMGGGASIRLSWLRIETGGGLL
jgi:hypothetical protein